MMYLGAISYVSLSSPGWLLVGLPVLLAAWWWRGGSRLSWLLRLLLVALVLLALSGLSTRQSRRAGVLIVVADRSLSMPKDATVRQKEWIDQLYKQMGPLEKLGVVAFGRRAVVEHAPQRARFAGFSREVGGDGSALAAALRVALALIPSENPGRIVLLSDGRWTGRDPAALASQAAARGIAIDHIPLKRPSVRDIAIERIDAPNGVAPGEAFMLSAWVHVPVAQTVRFVLKRGKIPLIVGARKLKAGRNRLIFRDMADQQGLLAYQLTISAAGGKARRPDPTPENNKARFMIGVKGPRPVLHVTTSGRSALAGLLKSGKLDVVSKKPQSFSWKLKELARYSAVLLENIPSQKIGRAGMQNLASWVKDTGAGLMITGGERAYGTGGYIRSPLEPIMPVSMRIKQEHRKLFLSMAIVLDRSCSMGVRVDGVNSKMDLANTASVQALKLLGSQDELAVLAVDTRPHTILPLSQIRDKGALSQRIRSIRASGGGIYVYEGLQEAFRILKGAASKTRHIILFSDTNDSEQPGNYVDLLKQCRAHGITVSVIGLGGPRDKDSMLLKDIAKKGGGRIFFTRNAQELPRLFAQDTMMVTKSSFVRRKTMLRWLPGRKRITRIPFPTPPSVGGYNRTYPKPGATMAMATATGKPAPFVAAWQAGLGRVLAYTGEVDGEYAGELARWEQIGDFLSSLVRWTSGHQQRLPAPMMLSQRVRRGRGIVELQLDPERHKQLLSTRPRLQILKGDLGQKPVKSSLTMRWVAPHKLIASIPLQGRETALPSVLLPGMDPISLAPMILPYSPEFRPALEGGAKLPKAGRRQRTDLDALARISRGKQRLGAAQIWRDIPAKIVTAPIGHWLLLLAVLLLLIEILERRAGLPGWKLPSLRRARASSQEATTTRPLPQGLSKAPARPATTQRPITPMAEALASARASQGAPVASQASAKSAAKSQSRESRASTPEAPTERQPKATEAPARKAPSKPKASAPPAAEASSSSGDAKGRGMFGALQKASQQAKRRTDRKK